MWKLRKAFWNLVTTAKFRSNRPRRVPGPVTGGRPVRPVTMVQRYPDIPVHNVVVADHVPRDEARRLPLAFCRLQPKLTRAFSPMQPGIGAIDADPSRALTAAYTARHRRLLRAPELPKEYEGPIDLGSLALAGPYSYYLEAGPEGGFSWDLRHLERYEHHPGLRELGLEVRFELDGSGRRVEATAIDCELGVCTPGDRDWDLAQRLALCAATNHLSLVRHFDWVHLATVAHLAITTRNHLPASHPLTRLLWPHVWGTQYSNELVTGVLLGKGGDFENVFSFTHDGLCQLFEDSYDAFDITVFDPVADAGRRGLAGTSLDQPSLANRTAHFDVMYAHARRYLDLYYPTDGALRDDQAAMTWVEALGNSIPNGVRRLVGEPVSREGLARLVAVVVYVGTVEHEVMGTGLWDYQVWPHVQPTRVRRDGQRQQVDVYQRLVNYNFLLNVRRAQLLDDYSYLALDEPGRQAFRAFRQDLLHLEEELAAETRAAWKVRPSILEVSVNG